MSGLIPSDFIRDLRQRVDIVSYIESTLSDLRKTGQNYTCKCPFHDDKTPSFSVSSKHQSFKCWSGCSGSEGGGDIYKFIQLYHNVSFKEAVEIVASIAGVQVPYAGPKIKVPEEQKLLSSITNKLPSMFSLSRDENQHDFGSVLKSLQLQDAKHIARRLGVHPAEVSAYACGVEFGFSGELRRELQVHIDNCSVRFKALSNAMSFTDNNKLLFPDKSLTVALSHDNNTGGILFITEGRQYFTLPIDSEFDESSHVFGMDTAIFPASNKHNPVTAMAVCPDPVSMLHARQKGYKDAVSPLSKLNFFSRGFLNRVYAKRNVFPNFLVEPQSLLSGDKRAYANLKAHVFSALSSLNKYAASSIFTLQGENDSPVSVLEGIRKENVESKVLDFESVFSLFVYEHLRREFIDSNAAPFSEDNASSLKEAILEHPSGIQFTFSFFQELFQNCSEQNKNGEAAKLINGMMEDYGLSDYMLSLEVPPIKALARMSHDRITKALIGVCMASSRFASNFQPENIPEGASSQLRALLFSVATTNSDCTAPLSPNAIVSLFDPEDKPVLVEGLLMVIKHRHESLKSLSIDDYGDVLLKANDTLYSAFDEKNVDDIVSDVPDDVVYTLLNDLSNQNLSIGELNTSIILGVS